MAWSKRSMNAQTWPTVQEPMFSTVYKVTLERFLTSSADARSQSSKARELTKKLARYCTDQKLVALIKVALRRSKTRAAFRTTCTKSIAWKSRPKSARNSNTTTLSKKKSPKKRPLIKIKSASCCSNRRFSSSWSRCFMLLMQMIMAISLQRK